MADLCLSPAAVSLSLLGLGATTGLDVGRVHLSKEGNIHGASQGGTVLIPRTTSGRGQDDLHETHAIVPNDLQFNEVCTGMHSKPSAFMLACKGVR